MLCMNPSTGWKATDAYGVGMIHLWWALCNVLLDRGVVEAAVDEVNEEVGEDEEEGKLSVIIPISGGVREGVVELRVSAYLGEEERDCEHGDPGHSAYGLSNLHPNLVLEELGVLEGCFIEHKDVGDGGDDEIDRCAGEPGEVSRKHVN